MDLSHVEIYELNSSLIGNLINLRQLDLFRCEIDKIANDTFINLKNLTLINMFGNTASAKKRKQSKFKKKYHLRDDLVFDFINYERGFKKCFF